VGEPVRHPVSDREQQRGDPNGHGGEDERQRHLDEHGAGEDPQLVAATDWIAAKTKKGIANNAANPAIWAYWPTAREFLLRGHRLAGLHAGDALLTRLSVEDRVMQGPICHD
jgi:hypothetical protein